jgi:hypothetical protein
MKKNKDSWKYVIKDMKKRNKWGMKQYGVPLTPETKKDFLKETYEELLDAVVYLRSELQLQKTHLLPMPTKPLDPIMDEYSIFHPYPFKENN